MSKSPAEASTPVEPLKVTDCALPLGPAHLFVVGSVGTGKTTYARHFIIGGSAVRGTVRK